MCTSEAVLLSHSAALHLSTTRCTNSFAPLLSLHQLPQRLHQGIPRLCRPQVHHCAGDVNRQVRALASSTTSGRQISLTHMPPSYPARAQLLDQLPAHMHAPPATCATPGRQHYSFPQLSQGCMLAQQQGATDCDCWWRRRHRRRRLPRWHRWRRHRLPAGSRCGNLITAPAHSPARRSGRCTRIQPRRSVAAGLCAAEQPPEPTAAATGPPHSCTLHMQCGQCVKGRALLRRSCRDCCTPQALHLVR